MSPRPAQSSASAGNGARVLVVDDEPNITELVSMALRYEGFSVKTAATGRAALTAVSQFSPALVILDVMLPDIDGLEVLRRLNSAGHRVPIIFLTARDATEDKVHGLTVGGDDYVTKPFSIEELVARVRVVLRRHGAAGEESGQLQLADLELDDEAHEVRRAGRVVDLTTTEYRLLRYLLINAGRVLTPDPRPRLALRLRRGRERARDVHQLPAAEDRPPGATARADGSRRRLRPPRPANIDMTRSLSGRLLIGIVSLVAVGLLVADVATYTALQTFLIGRVDVQLSTGHNAAVAGLGGSPQGNGPPAGSTFPADTIIERVQADGTVLDARRLSFGGTSSSSALPVLPKPLPSGTEKDPAVQTLNGINGVSHYRAAIWPEDSFRGEYVVLAIPLLDVESTLGQLLQLEVLISFGVVAATAVLALIIIRIGLRPLRRMAGVAQDIAAGDLTRRVEPATQDTEIGRLGIALNGMLSQIEAAFGERTRSEQRLRRFIADASHELRTPLTSVRGYAEMLRRGAQESPEDASIARRRIEEESVRMSLMVDDMLVLARLGQGRPLERVPVDLQSIARDAVADAHAVAPQRSITLDARAPVVITGDDTRLRQAVGNLMRNALVHTPNATAIEVALETHDGVATMSVVDHGPGLKPDDAGRVFEPFYRADASRSRDSGGAGLGLSIVAAVVDAHGGRVKVSETPGGGATFEVALPIAKA